MAETAKKTRPWWKPHASSWVAAAMVLALGGVLNSGAAEVAGQPCFGAPLTYLTTEYGDPFGDNPFLRSPHWLWHVKGDQAAAWQFVSLGVDAGILLVVLVS